MSSLGQKRSSGRRKISVDKERVFICQRCRARCTVGSDGVTEYGHRYGCPARPDDLRPAPKWDSYEPAEDLVLQGVADDHRGDRA